MESEEDHSDDEFQPTKQKRIAPVGSDFNPEFSFFMDVDSYTHDTWAAVMPYVKRKGFSRIDDKIKKMQRDAVTCDAMETVPKAEDELSDDELQKDNIRMKKRELKKKQRAEQNGNSEETSSVEIKSFQSMNLSRALLKAVSVMGYETPTPIQVETIPVALAGRDICGCAATGTGKTAAYMLPVLERLLYKPKAMAVTRVLVIVPTRELAVQVFQVTKDLSQFMNIEMALAVGGLDEKVQAAALRKNPDIVIATPGRLIDHLLNTPTFSLDSIEILILDEADRMLDDNFSEQMKQVIKQCSRTRQTMLFSATMTDNIKDLTAVSFKDPVQLFVDSNKDVAFNLRQEFVRIRRDGDRPIILAALVCRTFRDWTLVFIKTKKETHHLRVLLGLLGAKVEELHGDLTQAQRLDNLHKFQKGEIDVLLCTDVAARGLDIPGVRTVINYSMPPTLEHYIHRVGRTARAGKGGVSVTLAGEADRLFVKQIIKRARNPVKNRIIPTDILAKYAEKLEKVKDDAKEIIAEEKAEKALHHTENQLKKVEDLVNNADKKRPKKRKFEDEGAPEVERKWFQSDKQRAQFKAAALKKFHEAHPCPKKKSTKGQLNHAEPKNSGKKKKKSAFDDELTNTSLKAVKKLRHIATAKLNRDDRQKRPKGQNVAPKKKSRQKRRNV